MATYVNDLILKEITTLCLVLLLIGASCKRNDGNNIRSPSLTTGWKSTKSPFAGSGNGEKNLVGSWAAES